MTKMLKVGVLFCFCFFWVFTQPSNAEQQPNHNLTRIPSQSSKRPASSPQDQEKALYGDFLKDVKTHKSSFNPTLGEEIGVSFRLTQSAKMTVHVYDPDWGLVKTISNDLDFDAGEHVLVWDGKDFDNQIVPDEAYFFTLEAETGDGHKELYDPTSFSGGEVHDIISTNNIDSQIISYTMPEMGRVLIRAGVHDGPLLNTIVDWKPRVKGLITEYWNGKDKDNLIDLSNHPRFKIIITYFSLPESSVITYGNNTKTYVAYKRSLQDKRSSKPERGSPPGRISPHYRLMRTADYAPDVKMTFQEAGTADNGTPILKEKTLVKIEFNEADKHVFQNEQFEICFFLDGEFYAEDESGYTPFNWVWNLSDVKGGEHILTVNLTGFRDQIGVLSRKIKVVK